MAALGLALLLLGPQTTTQEDVVTENQPTPDSQDETPKLLVSQARMNPVDENPEDLLDASDGAAADARQASGDTGEDPYVER